MTGIVVVVVVVDVDVVDVLVVLVLVVVGGSVVVVVVDVVVVDVVVVAVWPGPNVQLANTDPNIDPTTATVATAISAARRRFITATTVPVPHRPDPADRTSFSRAVASWRAMKTRVPVLRVEASDGSQLELPVVWLRDSCQCDRCVHPSGQRLIDPTRFPSDLEPTNVRISGDRLFVRWMPEDHESHYSLRRLGEPAPSQPVPFLWNKASSMLPVATHPAITSDDAALLDWLRGLAAMGCALLRDVPVVDGEVARVAELFAHVRETNYGRWFDVRSVVDPANLADSALGLAPHTDNPYRDPVPTMQLLHCLQSSASGGENMLVDGWHVAEQLRTSDSDGFDALTTTPVTFAYRDATAELITRAPLIEIDASGAVRAIRFNPRSMRPAALPDCELVRWYDAYLLFANMLVDPAHQIRFRLDPGELFVVDNRRVLHGRTAFEATSGTRHLQGCYADIDGLQSTIAVLSRREMS